MANNKQSKPSLEKTVINELAGHQDRIYRLSEIREYSRKEGGNNPELVGQLLQKAITDFYPESSVDVTEGDLSYLNRTTAKLVGPEKAKLAEIVRANIHKIFKDMISYIRSVEVPNQRLELALGLIGAVPADESNIGNAYTSFESISEIAKRRDIEAMRKALMDNNSQKVFYAVLAGAPTNIIEKSFMILAQIAQDSIIAQISSKPKDGSTQSLDLDKVSNYVGSRIKELEDTKSPEVMGIYERLAGLALGTTPYQEVLKKKN